MTSVLAFHLHNLAAFLKLAARNRAQARLHIRIQRIVIFVHACGSVPGAVGGRVEGVHELVLKDLEGLRAENTQLVDSMEGLVARASLQAARAADESAAWRCEAERLLARISSMVPSEDVLSAQKVIAELSFEADQIRTLLDTAIKSAPAKVI